MTENCELYILLITLRLTHEVWFIIRNAILKHYKQYKKANKKIVTWHVPLNMFFIWNMYD